MKNLTQLQQDLISVINDNREYITNTTYRSEVPMELTSSYNIDGTFTYSRAIARESLNDYVANYPYLLGDIVKYFFGNLDMEIGSDFFTNPEQFQVCVLIEIIDKILFSNDYFIDFVYGDDDYDKPLKVGKDSEELNAILDRIVKDIENDKINYDELF